MFESTQACTPSPWNCEQPSVVRSRLYGTVVDSEAERSMGPHYERLTVMLRNLEQGRNGTRLTALKKSRLRGRAYHCKFFIPSSSQQFSPHHCFWCQSCDWLWPMEENVSRHALYHPHIDTFRGTEGFCHPVCSPASAMERACFLSQSLRTEWIMEQNSTSVTTDWVRNPLANWQSQPR